ncbi:MAG TPA: UDP-N-acetylmuramyl-tripeptide synthetase, partial [Candidatus Omnitrophica bacterium]|nr:UDP-N-acetylmuramyl-tripeptide synthetase [Candidatus Omnitrophota bacterium]
DDEYGQKLIKVAQANIITYSIDTPSDIRAEDLNFDSEGMTFNIVASNAKFKIRASLIGRHNVYNILAAFAVGFCENIASEDIIAGISNLEGVPGRLERIKGDYPFSVFIDYAHTENALQNVLATLGKIKQNRLILVFGCGGNRDTTKRAKMGRIAEDMADSVIITSDNPRNENPQGIIKDILSGIKNKDKCDIILERYSAITKALSLAEEGDIVLIAGKGHEQYQILKNKKIHFDDRKTAKNILDKKFNIE